jgi:hypothetical protein
VSNDDPAHTMAVDWRGLATGGTRNRSSAAVAGGERFRCERLTAVYQDRQLEHQGRGGKRDDRHAGPGEWAEQVKRQVNAGFDRVANALKASGDNQSKQDRLDIDAVIYILERKRLEVLARDEAGYFIRNWQELSDLVRRLIGCDPAYQAIRARARGAITTDAH